MLDRSNVNVDIGQLAGGTANSCRDAIQLFCGLMVNEMMTIFVEVWVVYIAEALDVMYVRPVVYLTLTQRLVHMGISTFEVGISYLYIGDEQTPWKYSRHALTTCLTFDTWSGSLQRPRSKISILYLK